MTAQELPLPLQVEQTPRSAPSQHGRLGHTVRATSYFTMGFAAVMLIGVYSTGGLESPSGSEKPSGHGAAAYSFNPPVAGMKTGGLRSAQTGGFAASAVIDPPSARSARVEAGASSPRLPQYFELVPPVRSRSGYPSMSEAEKDEAAAEVAKEKQDIAAAIDGVVQEVEGGGVATAVAEKEAEKETPKEDPKTKTVRTQMTAPWYTKAGNEQWNLISKEENVRRKANAEKNEMKYAMDSRSTWYKIVNGLVYQFPGWVSRGFIDAWEDDMNGVVQPAAKKVTVDPADLSGITQDRIAWWGETPIYTKDGQQLWKDKKGDAKVPVEGGRDDVFAWANSGWKGPEQATGFDSVGRPEGASGPGRVGPALEGTRKAPKGTAPQYWRWALPFVSDAAWAGKLTEAELKIQRESPWYSRAGLENWAVGTQESEGKYDPLLTDSLFADPSSRRAKSKASMEKLVPDLPPPWTKAGVEYANKNGIGQYVKFYRQNSRIDSEQKWEKTYGGESQVDGKWGALTEEEDPLKDDAFANTLKALSVASRERYGNYASNDGISKPEFKTDPWEDSAILNTLRALSSAFAERLQLEKVPRTFKTDAIVFTLLEIWEKQGRLYGAGDNPDLKKMIADHKAGLKVEDEKESNDVIIRALQDLSAGSANWLDDRSLISFGAKVESPKAPDNVIINTEEKEEEGKEEAQKE